MLALVIAQTVALVLLGLLVAGLLRSHAEILRALHDLGAGLDPGGGDRPPFTTQPGVPAPRASATPAHDVAGTTPDGDAAAYGVTGVGQRTLLAFLSSGCLTCRTFWDAFADPRGLGLPSGTRLLVVTAGADRESPSSVAELAPAGIPVVMSSEAWDRYEVPGSPYFVLVDGPDGVVAGEGSASTWRQVSELLGRADGDTAAARNLPLVGVDGAARAARDDAELAAAGIHPGHPSLYPTPDDPPAEA